MAESKRPEIRHKVQDDEAEQAKRDRMFLIIFFTGLVAVVIGMIFLAKFLSGS